MNGWVELLRTAPHGTARKTDCAEGTKRKESSLFRQADATIFFGNPSRVCNAVSNITINRRHNVLTLFQRFAEEQMRAGVAPKGLEQAFAATLQISPSMWSQIKSSRPIGDKLSRQIESACRKDPGWLDEARASEGLTAGEQQFLALALKAWRSTNAEGRKRLKASMKDVIA